MADPLVAAMRLRQQQKADEARRYREEQRVLLESGAGPTTTPISGEQTDPWSIIGDAAVNDATAYGEQVGEAFMPEAERSYRGMSNLVGNNPLMPLTSAGLKFATDPIGGVNAAGDMIFGSLNALSAPIVPPAAAMLEPALSSEGGQQFVSGLSALGDDIEGATGITKQNQLDIAGWIGAPVAGAAISKGVKAGAKKVAKALDSKKMAERIVKKPVGEADPSLHSPDMRSADAFADMNSRIEGLGQELADPLLEGKIKAAGFKDALTKKNANEIDAWFEEQLAKPPERVRLKTQAEKKYEAALKAQKGGGDVVPFPKRSTKLPADKSKGPASERVKVQPGQSLWDAISDMDAGAPKPYIDPWEVAPQFKAPQPGAGVAALKAKQAAREAKVRTEMNEDAAFEKAMRDNAARQQALDKQAMPVQSLVEQFDQAMDGGGHKPAAPAPRSPHEQPPHWMDHVEKDIFRSDQAFKRRAKNPRSAPTVRYIPEGTMYGDRSGWDNVRIETNPKNPRSLENLLNTDKDGSVKPATGDARYMQELRFLIDANGDTHWFPAKASYHNDAATFLTGDRRAGYKMLHGYLTRPQFDAALKSGAKTIEDVVAMADSYYLDWVKRQGVNSPEWTAAQKTLADSYGKNPPPPTLLEQFDNPQHESAASREASDMQRRMFAYDAWSKLPRKKNDPLIKKENGMIRYMERSAMKRSPLDELDNPDPKSGEIAAARARADELFAYKKEQPAATRPEAVPEIKAQTRAKWLDPERPILQPKPIDRSLPGVLARTVKKEGGEKTTVATKKGGTKTQKVGVVRSRPVYDKAVAEAKAKVGKDFVEERAATLSQRNSDDHITTSNLAARTNKTLEDHIAMTPEERLVNYAEAEKVLREARWDIKDRKDRTYNVGMANVDGGLISFFGANKKLLKNSKGFEGGDPITLPNGQTVESTGMSLAAFYEKKGFQTCPRGQPCNEACLAETSGGNFVYETPGVSQKMKTNALLDYPEASAVAIFEDIAAARAEAASRGNILTVRMNVLSDLDPKIWAPLIKHFDDTLFIDYTKMKYEPLAPNHHLTYSSTGASNELVSSLYANWDQSKARLDRGDNVAMAFSTKDVWPKWAVDEETGKVYRVVDGVTHDFRIVDLQESGREGVIVGLKNMDLKSRDVSSQSKIKNDSGKGTRPLEATDDASVTSSGFMVKYDPKATTYKTGKEIRDPQGNVIPPGDIAYIPKQMSAKRSRLERNKTGPQTAISVGGKNVTPLENQSMKGQPSFSQRFEQQNIDRNLLDSDVDPSVERELQKYIEQGKPVKGKSFGEEYKASLWEKLFSRKGDPLKKTIHGKKIPKGAYVVGRREFGGEDRSANPRKLAEVMLNRMRKENPESELKFVYDENPKADMGSYNSQIEAYSDGSKRVAPTNIILNTGHGKMETAMSLAHESGHALERSAINKNFDDAAFLDKNGKDIGFPGSENALVGILNRKTLPAEVLEELPRLYHDAYPYAQYKKKMEARGKTMTPIEAGYTKASVQPEQLAEAVRLYLYHPAKIKAQYPKTAKWISENLSNEDVVFNEAGAGLAGVMAAKYLAEQQGDR